MRKVTVTFSGKAYDETTRLIVERAPQMGADEVMVFDDRWLIETDFYRLNRWIFEAPSRIHGEGPNGPLHKHGFGWTSWKAFVISSAMDRLNDGDVILYLDADTYPVAPFGQLFDACAHEGGLYLFAEMGCSNLRYTKADCHLVMGLPVEDGPHGCARFSLWQKGPFLPRQALAQWWAYSINPRCSLWDSSILQPDPPEYYRNSAEQSVLTNISRLYGLPLHRTPDQAGAWNPANQPEKPADWDLYGQVFEQLYRVGNRGDLSGSSYRNV